MRMTIGDVLNRIGACNPARAWASRLGERAFYKAWHTCPKAEWLEYIVYHLQGENGYLTEKDRRMYRRLGDSFDEYMRTHGFTYMKEVPGRVVRNVVPWTYIKKLLRRLERSARS